MKPLRIILLVQEGFIPPAYYQDLSDEDFALVKTEYDVRVELDNYGHDVRVVELVDTLDPLTEALADFEPHIVFNLMESFQDDRVRSHAVVAYLEAMRVPYAGCNPRGLTLAQDKSISKAILAQFGLPTPGFRVITRGRPATARGLHYPLIVKSLRGDASEGLSQASVVRSKDKLAERVSFIHRTIGDALIEEYIHGRELYCGIVGNRQLEAFPIWELRMPKLRTDAPFVATWQVKWNAAYQDRIGLEIGRARGLDPKLEARIQHISKRAFSLLGMTGWGRMDFRLSDAGEPYFLEANPNGDIAHDEEFASSAAAGGYSYLQLLHRIIKVGLAAAR